MNNNLQDKKSPINVHERSHSESPGNEDIIIEPVPMAEGLRITREASIFF